MINEDYILNDIQRMFGVRLTQFKTADLYKQIVSLLHSYGYIIDEDFGICVFRQDSINILCFKPVVDAGLLLVRKDLMVVCECPGLLQPSFNASILLDKIFGILQERLLEVDYKRKHAEGYIELVKDILGYGEINSLEIESIIDNVLIEEKEAFDKVLEGNNKPFQYLLGCVMKKAKGKGSPVEIRELLLKRIESLKVSL